MAAALLAGSVLAASFLVGSRQEITAPTFSQIDRQLALTQDGTERRARLALVPYEAKKDASHIHAAFRVSGAGTLWLAPEELGLTEDGRRLSIHTHDATGVVHLHRPRQARPFTISQVLAVWGISSLKARLLVNGRPESPDYVLKDRDDVVLALPGGPRLESFNWKAVPLEDR